MTAKATKQGMEQLAPTKIAKLLKRRWASYEVRSEIRAWIRHLRAARAIQG